MKICHACKRELAFTTALGRRDECPSCGSDLHCCLNCSLYDPKASRACREPVAEAVKEKQKANYCEYFIFREAGSGPGDGADTARKLLDDLFKP
jgi:hypothetical protein